jgi:hypothetical protein
MRKTRAFLLKLGVEVVMPRADMDESLMLLVRQQLAAVDDYSSGRGRGLVREIQDLIREIHEKERQLAVERKQREIIENAPRQEEARKRSAARIQAGEFSIWIKYDNEHRTGTPQELITKGGKIWASDRTPITVDGKVCVGPRLGEYMGINFASIHFSLCGISRNCITRDGVTYDGTYEPQLY